MRDHGQEGWFDAKGVEGSAAYRLAEWCGVVMPVRFKRITVWKALGEFLSNYYLRILDRMIRFSIFPGSFSRSVVRPALLRMMGCKVGRRVSIGDDVLMDRTYAHLITIEDGATLASRCLLLVHQRDLTEYRVGMWIRDCRNLAEPIRIGRGVHVGMGSIICPGVDVGDGAIIGAGAVVTKDIPPYTVAAGVPARVLREIPQAENEELRQTAAIDE
jgi:acetyltransferase-like isoleucine patch superfamily enzyme